MENLSLLPEPNEETATTNLTIDHEYGNIKKTVISLEDKKKATELSIQGAHTLVKGEIEEAIKLFDQALALQDDSLLAWIDKLFALDLLDPPIGWEKHQAIRREFGALFPPFNQHPIPVNVNKKLTIGYVSADFNRHSAFDSFGAVIRHHTPNKYKIIMYSSTKKPDSHTKTLEDYGELKIVNHLNHLELAALIKADGVDILVDLSGITAGGRLVTFGRKPAPIQITAWGYGGGTGLPSMDYHFADPVIIPKEVRHLFVEKIWDLPCQIAYFPTASSITPVVAPPVLSNGYITFGNLGRYTKITDSVLHLWAEILRAVPKSRLVVKDYLWETPGAQKRIWEIMEEYGVSSYRLELKGRTPQSQHRLYYSGIDIVLDTYPHGGGITNFEATFMGCPVITQLGPQPGARIGGAVLTALGLQELVAGSREEYKNKAIELASDSDRLMKLRRISRQRIMESAAGNPVLYTQAVEKAYDEMWRILCQK